jgi:hypothetical protein
MAEIKASSERRPRPGTATVPKLGLAP